MLRWWRKAQGQDIMIHTCESGHFVIWAAFTPIPLRREGGRKGETKEACKCDSHNPDEPRVTATCSIKSEAGFQLEESRAQGKSWKKTSAIVANVQL